MHSVDAFYFYDHDYDFKINFKPIISDNKRLNNL